MCIARSGNNNSNDNPLNSSTALDLRNKLQQADERIRTTEFVPQSSGPASWEYLCGQYVRRPASRAWGAVHFTGGAILGSFPHIAYSALLEAVAEQAQVIVIASPFDVSKDHQELSEQCDSSFKRALYAVCDADGYDFAQLPMISLGHSLGSKLQLLSSCSRTVPKASTVLISFNNASAADTVGLVERFAKRIATERSSGYTGQLFSSLADALPAGVSEAVSAAARAAGVEFTPWPEQTLSIAQSSFTNSQQRLDLIQLEDDDLDMGNTLASSLREARTSVSVHMHSLPGNHLTPVCTRVSAQQMSTGSSELDEQLGTLQGLTLGDETAVNALASLVSSIIARAGR
jgi:hypothetical protein